MTTAKVTTAKKPAAKKPAAKKVAAPAAKKPAAKKVVAKKAAAPAPAPVQEPAAAPVPAQAIPYHYVVLFELENEQRKTADGVLTIDRPITDQAAYENIKAQLIKHFKLEDAAKAVTITTLHRLDSVQLLMEPAKA